MGNSPSRGNVIIYSVNQFGNVGIMLGAGNYKKFRMEILGFDIDKMGSFKIGPHTVIELFERDHFKGQLWTIKNDSNDQSKDVGTMGKIGPVGSLKIFDFDEYVPTLPDMSPDFEPKLITLKEEQRDKKVPEKSKIKESFESTCKQTKDMLVYEEQNDKDDEEIMITRQLVPSLDGTTSMELQQLAIQNIGMGTPMLPNYTLEDGSMYIENIRDIETNLKGIEENIELDNLVLNERPVEKPLTIRSIRPSTKHEFKTVEVDGDCVLREIALNKDDSSINRLNNIRELCSYEQIVKRCKDMKVKEDEDEKKKKTAEISTSNYSIAALYSRGDIHSFIGIILILIICYLITKLKK
jgi:hypothetical protein